MDKSIQKEYEDQLDMFSTPGWKDLTERLKVIRDNEGNIANLQTSDQFYTAKGKVEILDWFLGWEAAVRMYPPDE